jgi:hypothetical protein
MIPAVYARITVLAALAVALAGCAQRYFYNKPSASYADFTADHTECVGSSSIPTKRPTHVLISSDLYRLCMREHGWTRAKQSLPPPLGWYRGQEKEDVVAIDAPPPPVPRSALAEGAQRAIAPPRTRLAPSDTNFAARGPVAPEAIAVDSVAMIAGRWEGKFITGTNEGKAVMLIEHDGRYAVVVTASRTGTLTGRIQLINGVLRGQGEYTGRTGTFALYRQGELRTLRYWSDDGTIRADLTPSR